MFPSFLSATRTYKRIDLSPLVSQQSEDAHLAGIRLPLGNTGHLAPDDASFADIDERRPGGEELIESVEIDDRLNAIIANVAHVVKLVEGHTATHRFAGLHGERIEVVVQIAGRDQPLAFPGYAKTKPLVVGRVREGDIAPGEIGHIDRSHNRLMQEIKAFLDGNGDVDLRVGRRGGYKQKEDIKILHFLTGGVWLTVRKPMASEMVLGSISAR